MVRIAVISDIHGNIFGLEAFFQDIQSKNIDEIICLGDVVGYYPYPNEVIELVRENCSIIILGNHDAGIIGLEPHFYFNFDALQALIWTKQQLTKENLEWLKTLPLRKKIVRQKKELFLVHGSPFQEFDYLYIFEDEARATILRALDFAQTDVLMVGHTHIPVFQKFDELNKIFLNPGSIGQTRNGAPGAYYAILDTDSFSGEFYRLIYDFTELKQKVIKEGLPKNLALRLDEGR